MSREAVLDAAARLFDLIRAGVVVVTLSDGQVYSEERLRTDWTPLIVSIAVMARAHEESRLKSERVGAAWARKKLEARAEGRPLTSQVPAWITIEDGKFTIREDRAEIVRSIFRMAIEGYGQRQIVAWLNAAETPTWRGGTGWQTSTVSKILGGRLALGEYQPHSGTHRSGSRQAEGDPIPGYYPAVIDEDTYWRARQASQGRRTAAGRRGNGVAHLLLGLGRCTRCNGAMHLFNKGARSKNGRPFFACSTASRHAGCENIGRWRVDQIEARLLRGLAYLDADAVLRGAQPTVEADRALILSARLDEIKVRRSRLLSLVEDGDENAGARYQALGDEAKAVRTALREAEKAVATTIADPGLKVRLAEAVDLGRAMGEAEGDERRAIRTRLAEQLRQLVAEVRYDPDLGVLAILTPRPGIPADQVPQIVGVSQMQAWRLWLNDDTDPSGLAGLPHTPDPAEDADSTRSLALSFAPGERRRSRRDPGVSPSPPRRA